jgi:hypothetical protein
MTKEKTKDWKEPKQVMKMLHEIEKQKRVYNIHYCKAGIGFIFYEGPVEYIENWRDYLSVKTYYPIFEEAVKAEWDNMKQGDKT